MKISGFTFVRNGTILGYPYVESIRSLLPLVDEFVVAVGRSDDDTLERVRRVASAEPKVRVLETTWNERMSQRGFVYAQQKMIAQYNCTGDWAFYLEGDEVVHEDDLPLLRSTLERCLDDPSVEALAFDYLHFYGTPAQIAVSPAWYRQEARVIRNTIRSYSPDGQYWVVMGATRHGRYPRAVAPGVRIFHYGHVRLRERMEEKARQVSKYWDATATGGFDYGRIDPEALAPYGGTHPAVVREWLEAEAEHAFTPTAGYRPSRRERRHRLVMRLERLLGRDLGKRHFQRVKGRGGA